MLLSCFAPTPLHPIPPKKTPLSLLVQRMNEKNDFVTGAAVMMQRATLEGTLDNVRSQLNGREVSFYFVSLVVPVMFHLFLLLLRLYDMLFSFCCLFFVGDRSTTCVVILVNFLLCCVFISCSAAFFVWCMLWL